MGATEIAEVAADGVANGMHVVGEETLAAEEVVRGFDSANLAYLGLGLVVGAAAGAFVAWKVAYRKAESKANEIAAEQVAEAREHYYAKVRAAESTAEKGESVEEIVRERGYSPEPSEPPMAVTPPSAVVERAEEVQEEEAETPPPPEKDPEPEVRNIFRDAPQVEDDEWDWHKEKRNRSPLRPFVIHIDERDEHEAYDAAIYTYYEGDDVVCNERDEILDADERQTIIGEENLEKFGHGSGDPTVVYVRNPKLEMDIEINRSPRSYAEEVQGFDEDETELKHSDRRRGRKRFDDE